MSPTIVNCHHYKEGVKGLPPNTVLIDRTTPFGNPYSSKSGKYTREECVALHRVDLYRKLISGPQYFSELKKELQGKDLACWCTHPKRVVACHGNNYLYILSPELSERLYDKSVVYYLMDDFRRSLKSVEKIILSDLEKIKQEEFLKPYLAYHEMKVELESFLELVKQRKYSSLEISQIISFLLIDCEYAEKETTGEMILYRLDHLVWQIHRFTDKRDDRDKEPISPLSPLKRKKK